MQEVINNTSNADCQKDGQPSGWSSEYLYIVSLWQLGDWDALSEISLDDVKGEKERKNVQIFKVMSLLQLNKVTKAKRLLLEISGLRNLLFRRSFLSSLYNTLGKARAIQGEMEGAQRHFISSVNLASPSQPPLQMYKARMLEQLFQLSLYSWDGIEGREGLKKLSSISVDNTEDLAFNRNITISFWLRVHAWPKEWTPIVGKLKSDTENEFCLRIKDNEQGQFYYSQTGRAIVLNAWNPSEFIRVGQWTHIAVVKEHDEHCRLYIDGIIRSERDISGVDCSEAVGVNVELLGSGKSGRYLDAKIHSFWLASSASTSHDIRRLMFGIFPSSEREALGFVGADLKDLSPMERLELETAKLFKFKIASRVKSLDYYELIDSLPVSQLTFVVVGANDGKYNDPLYQYLMCTQRDTRVVLVEPQTQLLPYLEENYSFHSKKEIVNAAVGKDGNLTLYGIKADYWDQLNVPYARERGWPKYRAPTGVASSSKQHVQEWLKKHSNIENADDAIEQFVVPSMSLSAILEKARIKSEVDVLQIDTEGFDDAVIYRSAVEKTRPKLIYFETDHLNDQRKGALYGYLESEGYDVYEMHENTIAIYVKNE